MSVSRVGGRVRVEHAVLVLPREQRVAAHAQILLRPVQTRSNDLLVVRPDRAQHRVALPSDVVMPSSSWLTTRPSSM
jgi:hypothetical protein